MTREKVSEEKVSVVAKRHEAIESGTYPAALESMTSGQGQFDPYARWEFYPMGFPEDVTVSGFTSLSDGRTSKGMEWARRILGKSDATDMKYGKDIRHEKRPVVNWGEDELKGLPCQVVVEKTWDEEYEEYKSKVINVLPPSENHQSNDRGATASDEDFDNIPF